MNLPLQLGNKMDLKRYTGMATYLITALCVAFYIGFKIDFWLKLKYPIFVILVPLLILMVFFYRVFKDTSTK